MPGSFILDISRCVEKVKGRTDLVVRNIMLDLFRAVARSPGGAKA